MSGHIHLVFSDPPEHVDEAEYNAWYDAHVQEILAVDGWEAATRYTVQAVVGADEAPRFRYLSVYELSCHPAEAVANLEAASMGSADMYMEMKDADKKDAEATDADAASLPLPPWFTDIRFGSWNGEQVGVRITPQQPNDRTNPRTR